MGPVGHGRMGTREVGHLGDLDSDGDSNKGEAAMDGQIDENSELLNLVQVVSPIPDFTLEEGMFSIGTTR